MITTSDPLTFRKTRTLVAHRGFGPEQISEQVRGLALDAAGNLHVAGDHRIVVISPDDQRLRSWTTEQPAQCVALDPEQIVYVGQAGQVEIFDARGQRLETWRDAEHMGLVSAIQITPQAIVLADREARRLRCYDRQRKYLRDIGDQLRTGGFVILRAPLDFVVDRDHVIHVAHAGRHRVEQYALDGTPHGRFGRFDGRDPVGFTGCCNPTNIALTPDQQLVTVEKSDPRIKVYTRAGELRGVFGVGDFDPACANMDAVVDARGRVYVVDTVKQSILVYEPVAATTRPAALETHP